MVAAATHPTVRHGAHSELALVAESAVARLPPGADPVHARQIAEQEGLLVGISSGANLVVAQRVAAELPPEAVVLTLFCDSGERYLTTDLFAQPESPDRQGGL